MKILAGAKRVKVKKAIHTENLNHGIDADAGLDDGKRPYGR